MRCTQCDSLKDKVLDSRASKDGMSIRRRRECLNCQHRYTTYEEIEHTELRVIKRDGTREALNREKLVPPGQTVTVFLGPLEPGEYKFFGDFHQDTAQGVLIAK